MLRPGATIRLLEHARSRRRAIAPSRSARRPHWARVIGGCRLDHDVLRAVHDAGLTVMEQRRAGASRRDRGRQTPRDENRRSIRVVPRSLGQPHTEDLDEASRGRVRPCTRTCPARIGASPSTTADCPPRPVMRKLPAAHPTTTAWPRRPCSPTTRAGYPCRPSAPLGKARVRAESTAPTATDRRVRPGVSSPPDDRLIPQA